MSVGFSDASDALHVLLGQDAEHLRRSRRRSTCSWSRLQQRRADVDGDDDVGAHRARDVDRQVAGQHAVDQRSCRRTRPARRRPAPTCWRASRCASSPSLNTTALPVTRSVATARNWIGRSSKSTVALHARQLAQHGLELHAGDHALGRRPSARRRCRSPGRCSCGSRRPCGASTAPGAAASP